MPPHGQHHRIFRLPYPYADNSRPRLGRSRHGSAGHAPTRPENAAKRFVSVERRPSDVSLQDFAASGSPGLGELRSRHRRRLRPESTSGKRHAPRGDRVYGRPDALECALGRRAGLAPAILVRCSSYLAQCAIRAGRGTCSSLYLPSLRKKRQRISGRVTPLKPLES